MRRVLWRVVFVILGWVQFVFLPKRLVGLAELGMFLLWYGSMFCFLGLFWRV